MKSNKASISLAEPLIMGGIFLMVMLAPVFFFSSTPGNDTWIKVFAVWRSLIPFILLFLINHFFVVPRLLFRKKIVLFIMASILLLSGFSLFAYYTERNRRAANPAQPGMEMPHRHPPRNGQPAPPPQQNGEMSRPPLRPFSMPPYFNTLIIGILIIGFDSGMRMLFRWSKLEQEKAVLEKENVQNQLAFLRSQISPHFFMNTLNNIHSQIDINTENAKDSIIKLSKLMRHLLYDSQEDFTSLIKEVEFIRSYINLMKLRFSEKVNIKVEIPENLPEKQIPPLLFTSLIENAFKHGISYSNGSFINLKMEILDSGLYFEIENSKAPKSANEQQSGIGLENTRKRLKLLYADNYSLEVSDAGNSFVVKLNIPL